MCILSQPIQDIASTNIFANDLGRGVHGTVYSMEIETRVPVAMLLPVPVLQGSGDDALKFVDLSNYPDFFEDMDELFPEMYLSMSRSIGSPAMKVKSLQVHQVGAFKASYVPSMDDFGRLDPQFRLDPMIWATLPNYTGFGFAVFSFDPGAKKRIHPMAYNYPVERPTELFFPTVHVHDGKSADKTDRFDHKLYYQHSPNFGDVNWDMSNSSAYTSVNASKTNGLVRESDVVYRKRLRGNLPNADQVLVFNGSFLTHEQRGVRVA